MPDSDDVDLVGVNQEQDPIDVGTTANQSTPNIFTE